MSCPTNKEATSMDITTEMAEVTTRTTALDTILSQHKLTAEDEAVVEGIMRCRETIENLDEDVHPQANGPTASRLNSSPQPLNQTTDMDCQEDPMPHNPTSTSTLTPSSCHLTRTEPCSPEIGSSYTSPLKTSPKMEEHSSSDDPKSLKSKEERTKQKSQQRSSSRPQTTSEPMTTGDLMRKMQSTLNICMTVSVHFVLCCYLMSTLPSAASQRVPPRIDVENLLQFSDARRVYFVDEKLPLTVPLANFTPVAYAAKISFGLIAMIHDSLRDEVDYSVCGLDLPYHMAKLGAMVGRTPSTITVNQMRWALELEQTQFACVGPDPCLFPSYDDFDRYADSVSGGPSHSFYSIISEVKTSCNDVDFATKNIAVCNKTQLIGFSASDMDLWTKIGSAERTSPVDFEMLFPNHRPLTRRKRLFDASAVCGWPVVGAVAFTFGGECPDKAARELIRAQSVAVEANLESIKTLKQIVLNINTGIEQNLIDQNAADKQVQDALRVIESDVTSSIERTNILSQVVSNIQLKVQQNSQSIKYFYTMMNCLNYKQTVTSRIVDFLSVLITAFEKLNTQIWKLVLAKTFKSTLGSPLPQTVVNSLIESGLHPTDPFDYIVDNIRYVRATTKFGTMMLDMTLPFYRSPINKTLTYFKVKARPICYHFDDHCKCGSLNGDYLLINGTYYHDDNIFSCQTSVLGNDVCSKAFSYLQPADTELVRKETCDPPAVYDTDSDSFVLTSSGRYTINDCDGKRYSTGQSYPGMVVQMQCGHLFVHSITSDFSVRLCEPSCRPDQRILLTVPEPLPYIEDIFPTKLVNSETNFTFYRIPPMKVSESHKFISKQLWNKKVNHVDIKDGIKELDKSILKSEVAVNKTRDLLDSLAETTDSVLVYVSLGLSILAIILILPTYLIKIFLVGVLIMPLALAQPYYALQAKLAMSRDISENVRPPKNLDEITRTTTIDQIRLDLHRLTVSEAPTIDIAGYAFFLYESFANMKNRSTLPGFNPLAYRMVDDDTTKVYGKIEYGPGQNLSASVPNEQNLKHLETRLSRSFAFFRLGLKSQITVGQFLLKMNALKTDHANLMAYVEDKHPILAHKFKAAYVLPDFTGYVEPGDALNMRIRTPVRPPVKNPFQLSPVIESNRLRNLNTNTATNSRAAQQNSKVVDRAQDEFRNEYNIRLYASHEAGRLLRCSTAEFPTSECLYPDANETDTKMGSGAPPHRSGGSNSRSLQRRRNSGVLRPGSVRQNSVYDADSNQRSSNPIVPTVQPVASARRDDKVCGPECLSPHLANHHTRHLLGQRGVGHVREIRNVQTVRGPDVANEPANLRANLQPSSSGQRERSGGRAREVHLPGAGHSLRTLQSEPEATPPVIAAFPNWTMCTKTHRARAAYYLDGSVGCSYDDELAKKNVSSILANCPANNTWYRLPDSPYTCPDINPFAYTYYYITINFWLLINYWSARTWTILLSVLGVTTLLALIFYIMRRIKRAETGAMVGVYDEYGGTWRDNNNIVIQLTVNDKLRQVRIGVTSRDQKAFFAAAKDVFYECTGRNLTLRELPLGSEEYANHASHGTYKTTLGSAFSCSTPKLSMINLALFDGLGTSLGTKIILTHATDSKFTEGEGSLKEKKVGFRLPPSRKRR